MPKPNLSAGRKHKVYPYLLRDVAIERADQVWSTDITYVGLPGGFMCLTAVIDWYSRYVLSWQLSNTLDGSFCLEALEAALATGRPEVFNTDQGVQFTAEAFTSRLEGAGVKVSMDGKGRCLDNVFVERLWRTVKYEEVYLWGHETVKWTPKTGQSNKLLLAVQERGKHAKETEVSHGGGEGSGGVGGSQGGQDGQRAGIAAWRAPDVDPCLEEATRRKCGGVVPGRRQVLQRRA
jgi:putative transposase